MSWDPDPRAFLLDLEAKPASLMRVADLAADAPWSSVARAPRRVVLIGMGSSRFAASVAASRLRARGLDAVAEYASAAARTPGGPGTLAVGISASGTTAETVGALRRHAQAGSETVALTNAPGSELTTAAKITVELTAGEEAGGVACRTFQHTLALLVALEDHLTGFPSSRVAALVRKSAEATDSLLATRDSWLPKATEILTGTGDPFLIAPVERLSSAEQGALMLREGPRLHADACETGDWLHVDVYLTKPLDYRALLFAGSRFDPEVMGWMTERGARVVGVGGAVVGASQAVRYPGDTDPEVALLTEIVVPELVAASAWLRQ
jgi:fructoselysine-6-P-deglycase FrlB-like protein